MNRIDPITLICRHLAFISLAVISFNAAIASKPNVIFILADDLGYGELGSYGQKLIKTPELDRMAEEGMRFTQFYAGATVCASSRCVLMTGKHTGHCSVRGNSAGAAQALRATDVTVAEMFQDAGYDTALIGKWGLGDDLPGAEIGKPNRQGFDYFFGYLNQVHAHNFYPEFLWRNEGKVALRNEVQRVDREYGGFIGGAATKKVDYSHDIFASEALDWVRKHKDENFFLYLALTIPHANNEGSRLFGNGAEVPDHDLYADEDWPNNDKDHAAMISRMDADIGRLLNLLKYLGIDENTLVIFTSDNGPHDESRHNPEMFTPSGPLRGMKRTLTDGGIRVPTLAWWPGTVAAGSTSDHVAYFGDFYATACDLAGTPVPRGLDSISIVPTLTGEGEQAIHEYLYWEFYEQGSRQAVRFGDWKAIREPMFTGKVSLYNLTTDIGESHDLAPALPELVAKAVGYMEEAHVNDPVWQVPNR